MLDPAHKVNEKMRNQPAPTVGAVLRDVMKLFRVRCIETAALDARLLVAEVVGCEPRALIWREQEDVAAAEFERLTYLVERRLRNEPVAHILGRRSFWSDEFIVSPETLIPRPDSETLITAVLDRVPSRDGAFRILDLGTGSGCLLISLLRELPNATGIGTDISSGAVDVAKKNGKRLGVSHRTEFIVSDWFSKVAGTFDIVIANPPYIVDKHIEELDPDIRDYEPRLALAGGADGLGAYRKIAGALKSVLTQGGFAAFEIGADQASAVRGIYEAAEFHIDDVVPDSGNRDRCILMYPCHNS